MGELVAAQEAGFIPAQAGSNDPLWLTFCHEANRHQRNLGAVIDAAATEIERLEGAGEKADKKPVNSTWASRFFEHARHIQDADLQEAWGRLLAGEVMAPGSFSLRTLQVLEGMGSKEASLWNRAVALSMRSYAGVDGKPILHNGLLMEEWTSGHDTLISHSETNELRYLGLLNSATSSLSIFPAHAGGSKYWLKPYMVISESRVDKELRISAVLFTQAGKEIASLVTEHSKFEHVKTIADMLFELTSNVVVYRLDSEGSAPPVDLSNHIVYKRDADDAESNVMPNGLPEHSSAT